MTVLPAEEEPGVTEEPSGEPDGEGTASDWLPGIRDEHEDDGGWQARWLDRPTWDRTVTPNIRHRTGQRPARSGRRRRLTVDRASRADWCIDAPLRCESRARGPDSMMHR